MSGINIDLDRDARISDIGMATLQDRYMLPDEVSPQEVFARTATQFGTDEAHAQRIYDYASKGWFTPSTPILTNAGTSRGMPISCFLNSVEDSITGITDHYTETAWLSALGGGVGGYWGNIRADGEATSRGSKSTGVIPFIKTVDSIMLAFSQGVTRRGSYASYIDISHPEVLEFINSRKPTGGDMNRKALNLHHAVVIPDTFMEAVRDGGDWNLTDPNSGDIHSTIPARELWIHILNTRVETGEPYIMFGDTVNRAVPLELQEKDLRVTQSNLCAEITLPTNSERTAVCCLSSVNLEFFEEWKDTTMVKDLVEFLDNVLEFFITNAPDVISKAKYSAIRSRDIGIGAMGFHSFLQSKGVPFESVVAKSWNNKMFTSIKSEALAKTYELAQERGACPDSESCKSVDTLRRHMHLLAVAPNASSSIICNTSPSVEPIRANVYTHKTLSGSFEIRNKHLEKLLQQYIVTDTGTTDWDEYELTWKSILANKGSVQHLDFLTELEKEVFKTAPEIDQHWVIEHAADRQGNVCQSQSINLFFSPDGNKKVDARYLHSVHWNAWEKNVKTLYYLRSEAASRVENINVKVDRHNVLDTQSHSPVYQETTCLSCEG